MKSKDMTRDANSLNRVNCVELTRRFFYETLDKKERGEIEIPEPIEATTFWSGILSEEARHNDNASWLEQIEQEFSTTETQEDVTTTVEYIINGVNKVANWKAAGSRQQAAGLLILTGIHTRFQECQQDCVC